MNMVGIHHAAGGCDRVERHDFWPRLWVFFPPFLFPPKKEGRRKGAWIEKLLIKSHAFLLDRGCWCKNIWCALYIVYLTNNILKLGLCSLWSKKKFWYTLQSKNIIFEIRKNISYGLLISVFRFLSSNLKTWKSSYIKKQFFLNEMGCVHIYTLVI